MTGDIHAELRRARHLADLSRWGEARRLATRLVASEPEHVGALFLLSQCHHELGENDEALRAADRMVNVAPLDERGHRMRAVVLSELGWHRAAVVAAREAVRLAPDDWRCSVILAQVLAESWWGRREARRWADRAVELAPDEPATHFAKGVVAAPWRRREAERSFREALTLRPDDAETLHNLAVTRLRRGRPAEAALGLGGAIKMDPRLNLARENIEAVAWTLLRRAFFLNLLGVVVLMVAAVGRETPPSGGAAFARPALGVALVVLWTLLTVRVVRPMPTPVRRYLLTLVRRRPAIGFYAAFCVGCLGATLFGLLTPSFEVAAAGGVIALPMFFGCVVMNWGRTLAFLGQTTAAGGARTIGWWFRSAQGPSTGDPRSHERGRSGSG